MPIGPTVPDRLAMLFVTLHEPLSAFLYSKITFSMNKSTKYNCTIVKKLACGGPSVMEPNYTPLFQMREKQGVGVISTPVITYSMLSVSSREGNSMAFCVMIGVKKYCHVTRSQMMGHPKIRSKNMFFIRLGVRSPKSVRRRVIQWFY